MNPEILRHSVFSAGQTSPQTTQVTQKGRSSPCHFQLRAHWPSVHGMSLPTPMVWTHGLMRPHF